MVRSIHAPTLIVVGDRDVVKRDHAVELTRLFPVARLLVLPGGHGDYLAEAVMTQRDTSLPELTARLIGPAPSAAWSCMHSCTEVERVNDDRYRVEVMGPDDVAAVVSVLSESFFEYPVVRFVLGADSDYSPRLERLITFFVMARMLRDEIVLGVRDRSGLRAAALVSYPGRGPGSPELGALREETWATLGEAARSRYEAFGAATDRFAVERQHIHLNMIGVRPAAQGRGLGRAVLGAVHDLSASDASSTGVTLTTERESNVALYEHFGYEVLGSAKVASAFTTWAMFRRDR